MERIIFFDGVCALCNKFVDEIIKKDHKRIFIFASLQSNYAKNNLPQQVLSLDTVVLSDQNKLYFKSTAVLRVFFHLGGLWTILALLGSIFPYKLRDIIYDYVAKNRYGWFGKYNTCRIPKPDEKKYFLD